MSEAEIKSSVAGSPNALDRVRFRAPPIGLSPAFAVATHEESRGSSATGRVELRSEGSLYSVEGRGRGLFPVRF
jgi:hypothetical protein